MLRSLLTRAFYQTARLPGEALENASAKWVELHRLAGFLSRHQVNVVLDVGANEGQFAAKLRRLGYAGKIVSFEPDPRAFQRLSARHGSDPMWSAYPIGLGDEDGEATFNLSSFSVLSSFLEPVNAANVSERVAVPIRRLDGIVDEVLAGVENPRVLLKTDTQGFDLHVLRSASGSLDRFVGILAELSVLPIYEGSPAVDGAISAYREAGFDIMDLSIVNRAPDGRVLEFDGLFVRRTLVA